MRVLLSTLICLAVVSASAQTDIESIKRNPDYICGLGHGRTTKAADEDALRQISSQIWTSISESVKTGASSALGVGGEFVEQEKQEIFTSSFTSNTIPNARRIEIASEPQAEVFRYVHRDEIAKMLQRKSEQIVDLINTGKRAEQQLQIDDALRNYYWALLLASSHTEPVYVEFDGKRANCLTSLPQKIKSVLLLTKAELTDCREQDGKYLANVHFTYSGHDVASLQLKYHDGESMCGPLSVRDGYGELDMIQLPKNNRLLIQYLYDFADEAGCLSDELKAIYASTVNLPVVDARVDLPVKVNVKKGTMKPEKHKETGNGATLPELASEKIVTPAKLIEQTEVADGGEYMKSIISVEDAITCKNPAMAQACFTEGGYDMFSRLLNNTGKITISGKPEYRFTQAGSVVVGQYCPIKVKLPGGKTFMEKLVFRFNPVSKKIESIAFALTKKAEDDIFNSALPWGETSRYTILRFMEDYQTAFALKRIDYIEQLFSDNAIIITGSVLSKSPHAGRFDGIAVDLRKSAKVRYRQFTKRQYIDMLKRKFDKEYVHLTFEDNIAGLVNTNNMLPRGAAFAIQIRQLYSCTDGYADRGYLTLFLNMQGKSPLIEVRLWQPEDEVMPYEEFLQHFYIK